MHNEILDTKRDNRRRKAKRNERLSPDGKWRSFPKVPHLLQYVSTGQFYGRIKVAGKPIRHKLGTDVFTNATLLLTDFIKKHRTEPEPADDLPTTFRDARLQYEQSLTDSHDLSEGTKRYRRFCINALLKSWPGGLDEAKPAKITLRDCQAWAKKFSKKVDNQYFNNVLGTLRGILDLSGRKRDNPAREVKRLSVQPKELRLPEADEWQKLLTLVETSGAGQAQNCADLIRFLSYSGCRQSEAKGVRWRDVDLKRAVITVHNAKVRRAGNARLRPIRQVPIIPDMRELLTRLASRPHTPDDPVCLVSECQKSIDTACKKLGIQRITHHDLRHLFATRCIESGVDVPTAAHWLGHSDGGALAMKTYGHLRDQHSAAMAQRVTFSTQTPQNVISIAKEKVA